MAQQYTIYSDDDVDVGASSDEDISDNEFSTKKSSSVGSKKKKPGFAFDFDNGDAFERFSVVNVTELSKRATQSEIIDSESVDDADKVEDDGQPAHEDNVRKMPRTDERAARAADRKAKGSKRRGENDADSASALLEMDPETEKAYFDSIVQAEEAVLFSQLNLSRPLLRAVEAAGYVNPTPVQTAVIPLAMAGRDVCASAVTGSGKTAAFVLPFLERLLYRPKDVAAIRVVVVTPTRELATQIFMVLQKLAQFTDITCCLICGGKKDVKSQEVTLRNRPDVIVCTPGRIIDHLRNSQSVSLDDLDVLVLDEVDRLLDLGFQEELEELVRHCPTARQTLLFSATMTPKVEDLAKLSLKKPVRVKTSGGANTVAPRLIQEFVKVRKDDERGREAMVAALVCRNFSKRAIVFYETKKEAHRFYAVLMQLGVKSCELHGDVTQALRYLALQRFRDNEVDVMVCTDVAARGLDIPGVQTVINAEMPRSASTYVHRVGRTARAGCGGRAVTFVGDARRKVMKDVLKSDTSDTTGTSGGEDPQQQVLSRTIPPAVVDHFLTKIAALEGSIKEMLDEESTRAKMDLAFEEAERAENLMLHEDEIAARPARTWYQTETQKKDAREVSRLHVKEEQSQAQYGVGKAAELARTAEQRAAALARVDDYRNSLEAKKGDHRLSRKKRRRLESLSALEDEEEGGGRDAPAMQEAPRKFKESKKDEAAKLKDRAAGDVFAGKKIKFTNGTHKIIRPKFAVGGLDQDMMDWGGSSSGSGLSKKQLKKDSKEKEFTEYNPDKKLRKGGKIGVSSFKSKTKFKRRK